VTSIALVAAAAGGVEGLREGLVAPLVQAGHQVAITLTPTAGLWLDAVGERPLLAELTGLPVRSLGRLPGEPRPHPQAEVLVAAPFTAGSVAKLALGIADNQALTVLCEAVATLPTILLPVAGPGYTRHPAWAGHLERLRSVGVQVLDGDEGRPAAAVPVAGYGDLPWAAVLTALQPYC
jgi:hypothetical protein